MDKFEQAETCPITYEITRILLAGGPEERSGFWKAYAENLDHNLRTDYNNSRVRICFQQLKAAGLTDARSLTLAPQGPLNVTLEPFLASKHRVKQNPPV